MIVRLKNWNFFVFGGIRFDYRLGGKVVLYITSLTGFEQVGAVTNTKMEHKTVRYGTNTCRKALFKNDKLTKI